MSPPTCSAREREIAWVPFRSGEMAAIGALDGLTRLEALSLNSIKGLTGIPACVARLPLKELTLCYCPIVSLPAADMVGHLLFPCTPTSCTFSALMVSPGCLPGLPLLYCRRCCFAAPAWDIHPEAMSASSLRCCSGEAIYLAPTSFHLCPGSVTATNSAIAPPPPSPRGDVET